ncbi:MAG TPA: S8 family peptidase [Candidatus Scalindua sp.]|nr:S8 family peptidase [Candidatus Scalindua sp.]
MPDFPHLKLPYKVAGVIKPKTWKGGPPPGQNTIDNKNQRKQHGENLGNSANELVAKWRKTKEEKKVEGIEIPNENDIPLFLKVDTAVFKFESLINWGIEVIAEEEDGYIIGASVDNLETFQQNVEQFINEKGTYKDTAAKIWELITDDSWRVNELLKGELGEIWDEIDDGEIYTVQLGISCYVSNLKIYPSRAGFDSEEKYNEKVSAFNEYERALQLERDSRQMGRESEIEKYSAIYAGEIHDIWDNEIDALHIKISICGKGLKDLVQNYQYLYEVKLEANYSVYEGEINEDDRFEVEVIGPSDGAPKVCIIDSGIQENHRLIQPAIDTENSHSYVDEEDSTADHVKRSGHGTKVAGAVLYTDTIPKVGQIKLESIIQNARILDKENSIPTNKFEPKLMQQIVSDFPNTKIFNLSVSEDEAFSGSHMPSLAASIDKLMHDKDILFLVSAGNLKLTSTTSSNPGIREHYESGEVYPEYLKVDESKISNPGVSYFAITVGSIANADYEDIDYKSIAGRNHISPFSRTGGGLWGCVKPDVVEFGGDFVKNKNSEEITTKEEICPELVNSTLHGAKAVGRDSVGTSFSTPKVSYIASRLHSEHPDETAQMYRALIVQSARLPDHCFNNPSSSDFAFFGYGIPNVERALSNSESRITFIQNGSIEPKRADIYKIIIPEELRGEKDYRILAEISLAFTSKTRMTRKGSHSYLANWIEWRSSKYNENFGSFRNRTIEYLEAEDVEDTSVEDAADSIRWIIRENPRYSNNGINRNNSTVQKSWAIIDPHQFAEEFSIAIVGHYGWDRNIENPVPYALCVSFEALDVELNIYEILSQAQIEIEPEQEIEI